MSSDMTAWVAIGAAGVFLLLFVGLLLRHSVRPLLLWPALMLLGALLLTPAPHPSAEGVWVPAFVIALFEGLFQSSGNPTVALRLLLASCVTALAVSGGICGLLALRGRASSPSTGMERKGMERNGMERKGTQNTAAQEEPSSKGLQT